MMHNLIKLISILELSKEQSLTGFLPAGMKKHEIPSLAEHHFTSALMALFLGQKIKKENATFDTEKLLHMVLIHDISELFGGDVAAPLSRRYPELKEPKDKIGKYAIDFLSSFLDEDASFLQELWQEFEFGDSDEARVGKFIDQIDHQFSLEHVNYNYKYNTDTSDYREKFIESHVFGLVEKIQDEKTRNICKEFAQSFKQTAYKKGYQAINFLME